MAEQCRVVWADRDATAMAQVAASQRDEQGATPLSRPEYLLVECDVTNPDHVQSLVQQADAFAEQGRRSENLSASSTRGTIPMATLLVNCAGITRDGWVSNMKMEDWNDVIDVNLKGTFLTCRSFLDQERMGRWMLSANVDQETTGISSAHSAMSIVNLGSIVSEYGNLGQANYAASKGGVLGLTRALAKESARRNVRVNCVLPGFIDTPMAQTIPDHVKTDVILPNIPMGRFGQPEEVADTVAFLLSPRSSYITGEAVRVSGMITL